MKIQFVNHLGMSKTNKQLLGRVNGIIDDYASQGYSLTLRQLYYQLVTRNVVANNTKEYDKLSNLITKGRLLGIVDWDAIVDRTRKPNLPYYNLNPEDAVNAAHNHYRLDRQMGQEVCVELWVEKDALAAVLQRKTHHYHIQLMVNRGYSSTTAMYDSYNRFLYAMQSGQKVTILYLGDHDPSGLDMIRDIRERIVRMLANQSGGVESVMEEKNVDTSELLNTYWHEIQAFEDKHEEEYGGTCGNYSREILAYIFDSFEVRHIGLTTAQVKQYNPPPNPAKMSDPRANWYVEQFGKVSWEVDALEPKVLHEIIDTNVLSLIDINQFNGVLAQEGVDKAILKALPEVRTKYSEAAEMVNKFNPDMKFNEKDEKDELDVLRRQVEKFSKFYTDLKSKF